MKNLDEVAKALKILQDNAVTFGEKNLVAEFVEKLGKEPVVEVIDENHQKFSGYTFHRGSTGYYVSTQKGLLHRYVWEYFYGKIPKGFHIHHKDHNKANNNIENLEIMARGEHASLHGFYEATENANEFICKQCGKKFFSKNNGHNYFCSSKCAHKYNHEKEKVLRYCERCGKPFRASKHSDQRCCSHTCASKLMWQEKRKDVKSTLVTSICPQCGKEFSHKPWRKPKFCSRSCAITFRNLHFPTMIHSKSAEK